MRRFLFIIVAALALVAVIYAVRTTRKRSNDAVASLLPRDTIALAHLPDFNRMRDDWRRCDVYQLYAEPAVQDFLRQPLKQGASDDVMSQRLHDLDRIDPKDFFVALTSLANDMPKIVAGFRFRGSQAETERVVAGWREALLGATVKHETIDYEQHKIDISQGYPFVLATAYDGNWFFASNDVAELKALLDRADGRVLATASPSGGGQDRQSLLATDENFRAAMAEMPATYALGFYFQPKFFAQKLAALHGSNPNGSGMIEQIRSVCVTTRFDNGKMHDVIFAAMPKLEQGATLERASLNLSTKDTLVYLASLLNFSKQLALLYPGTGDLFGGVLGKITNALATSHVSPEDWTAAFGPELGLVADWPATAHWPSGVVAIPIKDFERAKRIASVLAHAMDDDAVWQESDRNGVHYITMQSAPGFLILRPTIAVTSHVMIVGPDSGSVESALARSGNASADLATSATYKNAVSSVPAPTNFFAYVDLALLYSRLDATLRPMLMLGAAFVPGVNQHVDLGRVPPVEVVTKHFSPIVSSQIYKSNGYLTESIGPITLNQTGIALVALSVFGSQNDWSHGLMPQLALPTPKPSPTP